MIRHFEHAYKPDFDARQHATCDVIPHASALEQAREESSLYVMERLVGKQAVRAAAQQALEYRHYISDGQPTVAYVEHEDGTLSRADLMPDMRSMQQTEQLYVQECQKQFMARVLERLLPADSK